MGQVAFEILESWGRDMFEGSGYQAYARFESSDSGSNGSYSPNS